MKTIPTRLLFNVSAASEALLGIALLFAPAYVIGLLLGDGLSPTGTAVARVLGLGLLSLGVAAGETGQQINMAARLGISIYNVGVAGLLATFGTLGAMTGVLLWPAAVFHGLTGAAMLWVILAPARESGSS